MTTTKIEIELPIEIIKIRLSTPVLTRTRCKKCGSLPTLYYVMYGGMSGWEPSRPRTLMHKRRFRMGTKVISNGKTRDMTHLSELGQVTKFKSYAPTYRRIRGDEPGSEYDFDLVEYLACECGFSRWAFSEKASQHRPEIINRKARSFFPIEIEY